MNPSKKCEENFSKDDSFGNGYRLIPLLVYFLTPTLRDLRMHKQLKIGIHRSQQDSWTQAHRTFCIPNSQR